MDKKTKTLSIAVGTALASSLVLAAPAANAAQNPFAINDLGSGYVQVADKAAEGSCGSSHAKANEGQCGSNSKSTDNKDDHKKKDN